MNIVAKALSRLACFTFLGCAMEIPDVPKASLTIGSVSPAEQANVNDTSTLSVTYSWNIANYDASKRYTMQILLYDTNKDMPFVATAFQLNAASGTRTDSYSGNTFYNCIFGCVRKAALPFRIYFTVEQTESTGGDYGTTLARTREYIYN